MDVDWDTALMSSNIYVVNIALI